MTPSLETAIFETIEAYRLWRVALRDDGSGRPLVGFVPTMGALHEGHATLIRRARRDCQNVVVSIFVNPLQFGPHEDFDRYPRTFPNDLQICRTEGVDAVFHPNVGEIYPQSSLGKTMVIPPKDLISHLCGEFRPGHFEGVATVVMKLFGIVEPTESFFGEKDYQQLTVIRRMVADLNFPTKVVGVATVREPDGLAMSSRNVYLTEAERALAPALNRSLRSVIDAAKKDPTRLEPAVQAEIKQLQMQGFHVQYLQACNADTLEPLQQARFPMVVLVAAKLGNVRLIDNIVVA